MLSTRACSSASPWIRERPVRQLEQLFFDCSSCSEIDIRPCGCLHMCAIMSASAYASLQAVEHERGHVCVFLRARVGNHRDRPGQQRQDLHAVEIEHLGWLLRQVRVHEQRLRQVRHAYTNSDFGRMLRLSADVTARLNAKILDRPIITSSSGGGFARRSSLKARVSESNSCSSKVLEHARLRLCDEGRERVVVIARAAMNADCGRTVA